MSKLSEAIDKAKREGQVGRTPFEGMSPAPMVAAIENATILPLTARQRPERQERPERPDRPDRPDRIVPKRHEARQQVDAHGRPEDHMVSLVSPHSFEAEQFRTLRHLVEQCGREAGLRVVAVTSAAQGDGKSLVAVNLAGALAQNPEARVLLLDADLRAPSVRTLVGLKGSIRGISDVVNQLTISLQDVIVPRANYNLSILQSGTIPQSPYEVLKSARFADAISEARTLFDFVVVDTPPVLAFPDTRLLVDCVDGFIFVVGADRTPRKLVEEMTRMFPEEKILGLVFNGRTDAKNYRYGTGYNRKKR